MELILISESKLKVMLSAEDMRRYDITCDELDGTSISSRRAFWSILEEAKKQTGFDPGKSKLFVQMYPGKHGGCELFVTRLGAKKDAEKKEKRPSVLPGDDTAVYPPKDTPLLPPAEECLYAFDFLSDLLLACKRLSMQEDPPHGRAYVNEGKTRFYLSIAADCPLLAEYNGERCRPRELIYIEEHCRLFCADAIVRLADLA